MKFLLVIMAFYADGTQEPKHMVPMPSYEHCMDVAKYYDEIVQVDKDLKKYATKAICFDPSVKEVAD